MILWNLISIVLVIAVLVEAYRNGWGLPKFNSFATLGGMWFVVSIVLFTIK